MRIRYFSDLHTEFHNLLTLNRQVLLRIRPTSPEDVCVCAGDIGSIIHSENNYKITMEYLSKNFAKVFVISGNHEYYNTDNLTIEQINEKMSSYFHWPNVHLLNNSTYTYNGVNFIGTTLWTHVDPDVPPINDIGCIPQLTRDTYNIKHQQCREWLRSLAPLTGKNVIITHHMPSPALILPKYKNSPVNQWFACDKRSGRIMDKFIKNNSGNIACWIYGHTHAASEQHIHGVPMLCNPLGYPGENSRWANTDITLM